MYTTIVDSYAICSHLHSDTAVAGGNQPRSPATAVSLWRACTTRRWPGWMRTLLQCLLVTSLVASCTSRSAGPPPTAPYPAPNLRIQYGLASWYGRERHGRRTASGEIFDSNQLVAAHRTAPFGTYALVTNLTNGRTVQVRINDRGPAVAGRVVDLSYAAARQLDMVHVGVTRVKVEFLAAPLPDHPRSQENLPEPSAALYDTEFLAMSDSVMQARGGVLLRQAPAPRTLQQHS
jgi:rare lipoprotein A (peptidoglycan hydrolase)